MSTEIERPEYVEGSMLVFLDELRESGNCNMFEAAGELIYDFPYLSKKERRGVLIYWMKTFSERHGEEAG